MVNYIEYLGLPVKIGIIIVAIFLVMQLVGEILEFNGKVVPVFLKVRKLVSQRKRQREETAQTLKEVKTLFNEVNAHYSSDNITKRNDWMESVNDKFKDIYHQQSELTKMMSALSDKLDKNNADTLSLLIDSKRNEIIDFASRVVNSSYAVTREQYKRIFKVYKEYEDLITSNGLTNGEVDIVYRIITESYEERLKNGNFVEDIRGYAN